MKALIKILIVIFCTQMVGQQAVGFSGEVTYRFTPNKLGDKVSNRSKDLLNRMYKSTEDFEFILKFNKSESFFEFDERQVNNQDFRTVQLVKDVVAGGQFYTNNENQKVIKKFEADEGKMLISFKPLVENDWKITQESKVIDGYACYKATKTKVISNSKGKFNFEIVAWFAPEIPVRFGPKAFNGLPGLILELKDTHHTFIVKEVKVNKNECIEIPQLKGKIITEEVYNMTINKNSN